MKLIVDGLLWDSNAYATMMKSLLFVATSKKITYLITREYKPKVVEKHFSKICRLSRAEIRQIKSKQQANDWILLAIIYNPMLPKIRGLIKKHFPSLHSDSDLKIISLKTCTVKYVRFLSEKEILEKSYLHHCMLKIKMKRNFMWQKTVKSMIFVEIIYLMTIGTFTCKVTNKKYYINNNIDCKRISVI